jgi:hypothetical protein
MANGNGKAALTLDDFASVCEKRKRTGLASRTSERQRLLSAIAWTRTT